MIVEKFIKLNFDNVLSNYIYYFEHLQKKKDIRNKDFYLIIDTLSSLHRALEHLLKLYLYKINSKFILRNYPNKFKDFYEFLNNNCFKLTADFNEIIDRIEYISKFKEFNFSNFKEFHRKRNMIEHWYYDENFDSVITFFKNIPFILFSDIEKFINLFLKDRKEKYLDRKLLKKFDFIVRNEKNKKLFEFEQEVKQAIEIYNKDPLKFRKKYKFTDKEQYEKFYTEVKCPICDNNFQALFNWLMDVDDVEYKDGVYNIVGGEVIIRYLLCDKCGFYVSDNFIMENKFQIEKISKEIEGNPYDYDYLPDY